MGQIVRQVQTEYQLWNNTFHIQISNIKMVKASKIEGMPKRPMSAYFLWMSEEGRAAAQKELGKDVGVAEISKLCGVNWKKVDESTKKKYEKKQAELKKKYDIEYPIWLENGGQELVDAAKKAKKDKKAKKAAKAGKKAKGKASKKKAESQEEEDEESEEDDDE